MKTDMTIRGKYLLLLFLEFLYSFLMLRNIDLQKMTDDALRTIDKAFVHTIILASTIAEIAFIILFLMCIFNPYSERLNSTILKLITLCMWLSLAFAAVTLIINVVSWLLLYVTIFLTFKPIVLIYWYAPAVMFSVSAVRLAVSYDLLGRGNIKEAIDNEKQFIHRLINKLSAKLENIFDRLFRKISSKIKQHTRMQHLTMLIFEIIWLAIAVIECSFMQLPIVIEACYMIAFAIHIGIIIMFVLGALLNYKSYNKAVANIVKFVKLCAMGILILIFVPFGLWVLYVAGEIHIIKDSLFIVVPLLTMLLIPLCRSFVAKYICGWRATMRFTLQMPEYCYRDNYKDVEESRRLQYGQQDHHLDPNQQWRWRK